MSRIPGTFRSFPSSSPQWRLVANPAYPDKPRPIRAACHDGTPCIDVLCRCGSQMHLHESQVAAVPADAELACTCIGCAELLVFPPGYFAAGFRLLREQGWFE